MDDDAETDKWHYHDGSYEDDPSRKTEKYRNIVDEVERHSNGNDESREQTCGSEDGSRSGGAGDEIQHHADMEKGIDVGDRNRAGGNGQTPPNLGIEEDADDSDRDENSAVVNPANKNKKDNEAKVKSPQAFGSKRKQQIAPDSDKATKRRKSNKKKQEYDSESEDDEPEKDPRWVRLEEDIFVSSLRLCF